LHQLQVLICTVDVLLLLTVAMAHKAQNVETRHGCSCDRHAAALLRFAA
jgi:hypothetical protein